MVLREVAHFPEAASAVATDTHGCLRASGPLARTHRHAEMDSMRIGIEVVIRFSTDAAANLRRSDLAHTKSLFDDYWHAYLAGFGRSNSLGT